MSPNDGHIRSKTWMHCANEQKNKKKAKIWTAKRSPILKKRTSLVTCTPSLMSFKETYRQGFKVK